MDKETIEKLREYKQLVAEGILTQEEFEREKELLMSNLPSNQPANYNEEQNHVVGYNDKPDQTTGQQNRRPPRTIHVPLLHRSAVMNESTPEGVVKKYEGYILRSKISIGIGAILAIVFIYYCCTAGFWAKFGAFFWAFCPASYFIYLGAYSLKRCSDVRDKFVNLTQKEFEYVQDVIRAKRADEKEAIITFADEFEKSYYQQTGRNVWYDTGAIIGEKLFK